MPLRRSSLARRTLSRLTGEGAGEGAAMAGERRRENSMQDRYNRIVWKIKLNPFSHCDEYSYLQFHYGWC